MPRPAAQDAAKVKSMTDKPGRERWLSMNPEWSIFLKNLTQEIGAIGDNGSSIVFPWA
ncbi:MAG: hypothetical protein P4L76_03205 [Beijerinckiaceae bacterium]|nr:hypothetical protein [Beijerinckiaceae bacterium]